MKDGNAKRAKVGDGVERNAGERPGKFAGAGRYGHETQGGGGG